MITIKDLNFKYPGTQFSLSIPSLEIDAGVSVGVHGPSGSGKSTFLELLSGNLIPSSGNIQIDHEYLSLKSPEKNTKLRLNKFGIIYQKPGLVGWMSVKDNILLPSRFRNNRKEVEDRYQTLVSKLEITGIQDKNAEDTSTGEQFRASIVRAFLGNPKVILADEPTASLDEALRLSTIQFIVDECKKLNTTLILVSHNQEEITHTDCKMNSNSWVLT